jgi:hypothetical protein
MDDAQLIEDARRRFCRSLVGYWSAARGSFNMVMGQYWEFRPDGTGQFTDTGPFGHTKCETLFEWRQIGDFEIELRITKRTTDDPDDEPDDGELDDEGWEWETIRYDFVVVRHDLGTEVALVGGLLSMDVPLSYSGPIVSSQGAEPKHTAEPKQVGCFTALVALGALGGSFCFWFVGP